MDTRNSASTEGTRASTAGQGASPDPAFSMFAPPQALSHHGSPVAPPTPEACQLAAGMTVPADPAAQAAPVPLDPEMQKLVDRALFKIKAMLYGSGAAAAGVMALLMTAGIFRPLRLLLSKRHADDLGWRVEWGIFGSLILWMLFMWLAAQVARRSGRREREKTLREGIAQAAESTRKIQEKLLADLRQSGTSEEEIAQVRATFEETRRKNQEQSEARIKDWAAHPEHMQAEVERIQEEIAARQAAKDDSGPANAA